MSAKWIWMRDCNKTSQYLKVPSAGLYLLPDTYELGETYQDGGKFYCKLTITDLAPYVEKFNAKFTDDTYVVCEEHTTAEFTYVLKYTGSTTDYKQDGTGWTVDASSYENNTEKMNGKTLWVAAARTVTYIDGVSDAVIFEDQVYDTTKGSTTPAWDGEEPAREGYTFTGWNPEVAETVDESVAYVAQWTANQYWVGFDSNGGEDLTDYYKRVTFDSAYGKLPAPEREAYDLAGWYDENGDLVTAESIYQFSKNTMLTAHWTLKTFTVTFEAEGETVDTIVVDWGTVLTDEDYPEVPAKEGYTGKWIIPADGITGDTTIVPEYTKVAPPVDTGDYAPIALPVALAGIAALVFCMKKREEDAE